jgi:hypothetical protein
MNPLNSTKRKKKIMKITLEGFKRRFDHFKQTVLADINILKEIAEEAAIRELIDFKKQHTNYPGTTDRDGNHKEPIHYSNARCAIPLCMVCFSIIDFTGKIIQPYANKKPSKCVNVEKDGFAKNAQFFFKYLAEKDFLCKNEVAKKFEVDFRHSIMHSFFPSATIKIGFTVAYTHDQITANSLFETAWNSEGFEILNVEVLLQSTVAGLAKLEELINQDESSKLLLEGYNLFLQQEPQ